MTLPMALRFDPLQYDDRAPQSRPVLRRRPQDEIAGEPAKRFLQVTRRQQQQETARGREVPAHVEKLGRRRHSAGQHGIKRALDV
jgi:hypothetical protein